MELFKKERGRHKKENTNVVSANTLSLQIPAPVVDEFNDIKVNDVIVDEINNQQKPYEEIYEELEKTKTEYQKLFTLYMNSKNVETKPESKNVVDRGEIEKLETSARFLYKKFLEISTGNNKFRTKYDSIKIQGINGVLDEIRKHFPTINFNK